MRDQHSLRDQLFLNDYNLIILIEDEKNNKFGTYVGSKIEKLGTGSNGAWTNDPNAFLFSLKSNGRIKEGMIKFEISGSGNDAFYLFPYSDSDLFDWGNHDMRIGKCRNQSHYNGQSYFNYHGYNYALRGNSNDFTPKRITAYQLK